MLTANLFKIISLEKKAVNEFIRIPEENLIMDGKQAASYHTQSTWGGDMDSIHLFHLSNLCKIIKNGDVVADLACGSGDLLIKTAMLFPKAEFIGVDLSDDMLSIAKKNVYKLSLRNISFITQDISNIQQIATSSISMVTSSMALHHLPNQELLLDTAIEINRILKPDGKIYICDFLKLRSIETVNYLVGKNRNQNDKIFILDYKNSLLAAFSTNDYNDFCKSITKTQVRIKKTLFANLVFTVTNKSASRFSPFASIRLIMKLPWRKIHFLAVLDFIQLKIMVN